ALPQVVADGAEARVSHGEIWIELNGALVEWQSGKLLDVGVLNLPQGEYLESFERGGCSLGQGLVEFLNRSERLAQLGAQVGGGVAQRVQDLLLARGLRLRLGERVAGRDVDGVECNHILAAETRNRAVDHRFDPAALADFAPDVAGDVRIRRLAHQFEGLLSLGVRKDIEER